MSDTTKRVLLVEDETNIAMALTFLIEREGYELDCVSDGAQALKALGAKRPDLVVLDAMIPEVSGYSVCQHIRETAELSGIKVLMISAAGDSARRRALEIGADAFFLKPFDTKALTGEMKALLQDESHG